MNDAFREDERKPSTPVMSRSRNQLASAYSPGAFFTFEGGLGACIAVPHPDSEFDKANIGDETKNQILLRLQEIWGTWYRLVSQVPRDPMKREIRPEQCIDPALIRGGQFHPLPGSSIEFVNPIKMGYAPAPLALVCNTCGLFREYDTTKDFAKHVSELSGRTCPNPRQKGKCQWRQLDVVFVHWSGAWQPASPGMWEWSQEVNAKRQTGLRCRSCGSKDFILNSASPRIGEWFFQCASCGHKERDSWLQNDPETTEILQDKAALQNTDRRMEPISYRASSAYYPQSETFVIFGEQERDLLALLGEGKVDALENFIATQFGFGETRPSPEEMLDGLRQAGHVMAAKSYENYQEMLKLQEGSASPLRRMLEEELDRLVSSWFAQGLVKAKNELPDDVKRAIRHRSEFSSRYDPFALAVEHECLRRTKLERAVSAGARRPFVRFVALDNELSPKDPALKMRQERETEHYLSRLGLAEMGLIREFDLCRFTHGFTRVNATPTFEKRNQQMPVRLNLFDPLRNNKRPIYVVTQGNEAIYVRLREDDVHKWLSALGLGDQVPWTPESKLKLGAHVLRAARPFGRYFSALVPGDADIYLYVYTLLHAYAHTLMKAIAEHSGLDLGSLGEYLFPANLAFVVYRNGTTMDLGNLSSLWRNENNRFLAHLLAAKTHGCNSGSLCDFSGGACPDCIMVPETSCIAANRLLSRAVLRGGPAPREDLTHKDGRIAGYLAAAHDRHHAK